CEVIVSPTRKGDGVEHQDASGAECLRSDSVFFSFQKQTANDKTGADDEPDRNPQLRWNQVVFERVFHEKRDAQEKGESADPREELRAHELLPVDRRFGWFGELRRFRDEELLWNWRWLWRCLGCCRSRCDRRHRG